MRWLFTDLDVRYPISGPFSASLVAVLAIILRDLTTTWGYGIVVCQSRLNQLLLLEIDHLFTKLCLEGLHLNHELHVVVLRVFELPLDLSLLHLGV